MKVLRCLILAGMLTGCASNISTPVPRTATFVESEYAPYNLPGTSVIAGQAFLKTRGGDVKFGAGDVVSLNPVTTYSSEWYAVSAVKQRRLVNGDPRADKYNMTTLADGNGNFRFSNLPAGEYYLICPIFWEVPSQYGLTRSGGIAHARVKVSPGQEVKVVLTR